MYECAGACSTWLLFAANAAAVWQCLSRHVTAVAGKLRRALKLVCMYTCFCSQAVAGAWELHDLEQHHTHSRTQHPCLLCEIHMDQLL